ncbi:MAG: polyphosphate polymerase domain-containing protein [Candidatus Tritonobacter lacicola]|nr:polyphosphate polymerase domain-containing protein [Candidatus Tritonobacter lacicola]
MIMIPELEFERYELKFYINQELYEAICGMLEPYMELDPHSIKKEDNQYTIRSLYLDNNLWDSYYENLDGLRVRRKLRIRSYGKDEDNCFLEIKKKNNSAVFKIRHIVREGTISRVLEGDVNMEGPDSLFLRNFYFLTDHFSLIPRILIEYEREAHIGISVPKIRVTFDRNVRAASCAGAVLYPEFTNWMEVTGEDSIILELKFDGLMPRFLREIVQELNLSHEPISKYCGSVRACDLV